MGAVVDGRRPRVDGAVDMLRWLEMKGLEDSWRMEGSSLRARWCDGGVGELQHGPRTWSGLISGPSCCTVTPALRRVLETVTPRENRD